MNNKKPAPSNQKFPGKNQPQLPKVPKVWKAEDYVTPSIPLEEVLSVK